MAPACRRVPQTCCRWFAPAIRGSTARDNDECEEIAFLEIELSLDSGRIGAAETQRRFIPYWLLLCQHQFHNPI